MVASGGSLEAGVNMLCSWKATEGGTVRWNLLSVVVVSGATHSPNLGECAYLVAGLKTLE